MIAPLTSKRSQSLRRGSNLIPARRPPERMSASSASTTRCVCVGLSMIAIKCRPSLSRSAQHARTCRNYNPPYANLSTVMLIDENFGRLRRQLQAQGIEDDTLLVFMTENGSSGAAEVDADGFVTRGYNAGMRGLKGALRRRTSRALLSPLARRRHARRPGPPRNVPGHRNGIRSAPGRLLCLRDPVMRWPREARGRYG